MISVIIPLYNAIQHIELLINQLASQTQPHELILIDSSSTDGTGDWLKHHGIPFHSIPTEEFNHGGTRNLGVSMAKGDIVVMLTQDALPTDKYCLARLIDVFEKEADVVLAYGRQLPYENATLLSSFARQANYPSVDQRKRATDIKHLGIKTCHCSNSFAAYRRSSLISIGGFPTNVILGEDVVVGARFIMKGYTIAYCSQATVTHSHNYSMSEEFKRYFDIGAFHQQEYAVLQPFLRTESEGVKYVVNELKFLKQKNRFDLIPNQILRTTAKYVGYRLGRMQHRMPRYVKALLSMHKAFWLKGPITVEPRH